MLTDDMSCSDENGSQDRSTRGVVLGKVKKRSFLTVDGIQEADVEVISPKDYAAEDKVKRSKKFRVEWMGEINFKDWLQPHPSDETYCLCTACDIKLRCGKSELEKHASGLKHTRRMEAVHAQAKQSPQPTHPDTEEVEVEAPQQAQIYCPETDSTYVFACDEPVQEKAASSSNNITSTLSDSALSGVLLKVLELVEGKMSLSKKKLEMAEIEHKCKMQILSKELQLKTLEVQIKEAELQKLKSTGVRSIANHLNK